MIANRKKLTTIAFKKILPYKSLQFNIFKFILKNIVKYSNNNVKLFEYFNLKITYKSPLYLSKSKPIKIISHRDSINLNDLLKKLFTISGYKVNIYNKSKLKLLSNKIIFIVFPNKMTVLPKKYVIIQSIPLSKNVNEYYLLIEVYKKALAILVSTIEDIEFLLKAGLSYKNIFYFPFKLKSNNNKNIFDNDDFGELQFYFQRFLLAFDNYDYNRFLNDNNLGNNSNKICLSLSETVERKRNFLSKKNYDFIMIEGLRHWISWVGAGLSYKYILQKMYENNNSNIVICEDDVVFPDTFENRLSSVIKYLGTTKNKWHIFSGLIAELREDTNIILIEEYKGSEYIYLDRMTSMVMNIYTRYIAEIINQWDYTDHDSGRNTIDRYLGNNKNIITVTTLPFIVGHAEEQFSTIWSHENGNYAYSKMIEQSVKKLARKVQEFKLNEPDKCGHLEVIE